MTPTHLSANDVLALWSWILLFGVSTGSAFYNARKNVGRPLAAVWYSMTALCAWWLLAAIIGLLGGPFVMLYRIGIGAAVVAVALLYWRGKFTL